MQVDVRVEERDGLARAGYAYINGFKIEIPHLLVVVDSDPSKQLVPLDIIKNLGIKIIMTSSYIAKRKIGHVNLKQHLGWEYILYTDSGTYQAYSQGVRVDPLESVIYQLESNVDIVTPVDEFSLPTDSKEDALKKALISFNRWQEALDLARGKLVSAPIQGGLYKEVRSLVTKKYASEGAKLLAIGGIVPLLVNYEFNKLANIVMATTEYRPWGSLVHAFGVGHPLVFPFLVSMGVDLFDSAMYSLAAKDLRLLTRFGTLRVEEVSKLRDFPEECEICPTLSPRELQDLNRNELERFIATYNLNVAIKIVKEIRERILYGTFEKWALSLAHVHPKLIDGYVELYQEWRDHIALSKRAFKKTKIPSYPIFRAFEGPTNTNLLEELRLNIFESYNKDFKVPQGKLKVSDMKVSIGETIIGVLTPSGIEPCPYLLHELGIRVKSKNCGQYIRKKDVVEVPFQTSRSWTPVILECGDRYALGILQTNSKEFSLSRDEDVVITRSSRLVRDLSELPCTPDINQQ
ncbi:hypothetical protein EYM_03435 [Ignicoccus islandicus DSM 13165]|uniref:tRNA-guanine(15) transglycosylase-like domain-containing protein n=1 Tax=Ignicoccus islandicus DSM 13165 TaxID=940295 RepID=A0A0U3F8T5_9CREN|nr:tRNA-guanine transglycosylase [Ignicoccus islandicus]ALU12408.1 hypothetical protein EYM_03435 [Ignicoccus islandicus DSM 13165]